MHFLSPGEKVTWGGGHNSVLQANALLRPTCYYPRGKNGFCSFKGWLYEKVR